MVEDWLALIGNMNNAVRDLRQAAPEVMKTFSDMARRPMWRSARRQDQRAGGASNRRRHALLALHPLSRRGRGQAGGLARGSGGDLWPWRCIWAPAPR
jgi:hypothetical protein